MLNWKTGSLEMSQERRDWSSIPAHKSSIGISEASIFSSAGSECTQGSPGQRAAERGGGRCSGSGPGGHYG